MKLEEKKAARALRQQGLSMRSICKHLGVSKSSVSLWVRDIQLTAEQKKTLSENGLRKEDIEARRQTRLSRENSRRQIVIDRAVADISRISSRGLLFIAVALYWGEGSKTKRGVVEFSNTDPRMIRLMMVFYKRMCGVDDKKFRGHVHIHSHLVAKAAEKYWSDISGIPLLQFNKTYSIPSKASKHKKDTLPYGTFRITVCDINLFLKIQGWTQGIYQQVMKM